MARQLEYLGEALGEAESAASWYAEQSPSAAAGFAQELDAAIAAIEEFPEAWPAFDHGTRRYVLRRYPFSVVYRVETTRILIVVSRTGVADQATGCCNFRRLKSSRALVSPRT